jgi:hypothetical protein
VAEIKRKNDQNNKTLSRSMLNVSRQLEKGDKPKPLNSRVKIIIQNDLRKKRLGNYGEIVKGEDIVASRGAKS